MSSIKAYFKNHPFIFTCIYTIIYFACFLTLERTVVPKYTISCFIDKYIPFCEYFIISYLVWFLFVPAVLFFLMINDRDAFWKMAIMLFAGNMLCLLIYALFPNQVPPKQPVENDNIFCMLVNFIYYTDTPTNVCPSIHVLDTLAAHIAFYRSKAAQNMNKLKLLSGFYLVLVCISTVSLKQHSVIDVLAAFLLCAVLYKIAYPSCERKKVAAMV